MKCQNDVHIRRESPTRALLEIATRIKLLEKKNIFENIRAIHAILNYDCMQYLSLCIFARRNSQLEAWGSGVSQMQHCVASKNTWSKIGRTRSALIDGISRHQQLDICSLIKSPRIIVFSLLYFIHTTVRENHVRARVGGTQFKRPFVAITTSTLFRPGWTCPAAHQSESLLG